MGAWTSATIARDELRAFLNDGPKDRPAKDKQLVGLVNGVNVGFFAFEERLVDSTPPTLVVTVDYVAVAATLTDPILGKITLAAPPAAQAAVRATYYFQYFLDSELDEALRNASGEINEQDDVSMTPFGLKSAVLNYGGYFCFTKQAIRWAERMSEKFILEDAPVDASPTARANLFKQLADSYLKHANEFRASYYSRHGRRGAPAFGVYKPRIGPIGPRR